MLPQRIYSHWFSIITACGAILLGSVFAPPALAEILSSARTSEPTAIVTRLFMQNSETADIEWYDVLQGTEWTISPRRSIAGFPQLDVEKQNLVQMRQSNGWLLVGVRDREQGAFQSGWVLMETGVSEESHGDHAHWHYANAPRVIQSRLDGDQGNPAHLYEYQGSFYLANDRKNGYTAFDLKRLDRTGETPQGIGFHRGGGNHITLAVAHRKVGYGTWIDGGGPDAGRVDVTRILPSGNEQIAYSFTLPSGNIHGAIVNQSKVFFAPADGICWVQADSKLEQEASNVTVQHLALGTDPDTEKPLRTGAFVTHRHYVLFVTGRGAAARLGLIDASADEPQVKLLDLKMSELNRPVTPRVVRTSGGKRFAFVFHNHPQEVEGDEFLSVIDLDPDGDLNFASAAIVKKIPVGGSRVEGHSGHHDLCFSDDHQWAFFISPGAKTLSVLSLASLEIERIIPLEHVPGAIVSHGGSDPLD
jgi:hypothetical protein